MPHEDLLSDQDFQQATDEQIFALVDKLNAEIQERGMSGIRWREPEELLEPSDPADPVDQ
jgi:hypothetical protein